MDELKEFNVKITKTYDMTVKVLAHDEKEAEDIATSMWDKIKEPLMLRNI